MPGLPVWLYLVLAHLVADFVLQPYELVRLKHRPLGLAIHAGIHAAVLAALTGSFLPRWWLVAAVVGGAHYVIDKVKVDSGRNEGPVSLVVFLADQGAHLATLALAALLGGLPIGQHVFLGSAEMTATLYLAVPSLTATFGGAILTYQVAVAYRTRPQPGELLMPLRRAAGYVERAVVLALVLFPAPAAWWIAAGWLAVRFGLERGRPTRWLESGAGLALAFALGLAFRVGVGP